MKKATNIVHTYVECIPKEIEEGIIYISKRFNTATHLCCCGCKNKVVTPLNSAKWTLTDHGTTVSLSPSIGLGTFPCRSHYWIRMGRVVWCPPMTAQQTIRAQRLDEYDSQVFTGERIPPQQTPNVLPAASGLWTWLLSWFRRLFSR